MNVCMYVCMYVCMCIYIYIYDVVYPDAQTHPQAAKVMDMYPPPFTCIIMVLLLHS